MIEKHLNVPLSAKENHLSLRPRGALVLGQSTADLREILNHFTGHHHPLVIIDLAEVTVIDADGLGALVEAHAKGKTLGTEIELENLPLHLDLLVLTKLLTTFAVRWPSLPTAA
jgi:anti-anti-sigma regulatory factor